MATAAKPMSANELLASPLNQQRCELVRGELIMMSPSGYRHGGVIIKIASRINQMVETQNLGRVLGAETGFILQRNPDTVRAPDVAFVCRERDEAQANKTGFFDGAPDLAIEVLSPSDRATEVLAKVHCWLDNGTREVWVLDPELKQVTIHRQNSEPCLFQEHDMLPGGELLPGFVCPVNSIFV